MLGLPLLSPKLARRGIRIDCGTVPSNSSRRERKHEGLRVLSLAHSAVLPGSSRLRYADFTEDPEIDLTLIVPGRWSEYGRKVKAVAESSALRLQICPIRIPSFWKARWYCHYYPTLSRIINELRPDVLHLWEEPWSVVAFQAARLIQNRFPETALVLETEQNIMYRLPPPFEQIRGYTLRRADVLIARQEEALSVSRRCGYLGAATIVEYCVDRTCFRPRCRIESRKQFDIEGFTIGYVGRLVQEKGLFTLLEAIARCHSEVQVVLVGEGPAKIALQARTEELKLTNRVRFLGGQPKETIANLLSALDLLVLVSLTTRSWKEQFGRVIIEAQACGIPVLGSSSGAIPSVVGKGGWIVQEGNIDALSELLNSLAKDPDLIRRASQQAILNVNRFSPPAVSAALRGAYLDAVKEHRRRAARPGWLG